MHYFNTNNVLVFLSVISTIFSAYVGQMVKCLTRLTYITNKELCKDSQGGLIKHMAHFLSVSFVGSHYMGYKGLALVQNCFIVLSHLLEDSLGDSKKMQVCLYACKHVSFSWILNPL